MHYTWPEQRIPTAVSAQVEMLFCGKHSGRRYHEVVAIDIRYCSWLLREVDEGKKVPRDLKGLADYIRKEFGGVIEVGKYKDSFYADIVKRDPDYAEWCVHLEQPSKAMANFAEYVRATQRKRKRTRTGGGLCCICMDLQIDAAFIPCGHMAACLDCARRIHEAGKCPICREHVVDVLRCFLAPSSSGVP